MGFQGDPFIAGAVLIYVVILFVVGFWAVLEQRKPSAPEVSLTTYCGVIILAEDYLRARGLRLSHERVCVACTQAIVATPNMAHPETDQSSGIHAPCGYLVAYQQGNRHAVFADVTDHVEQCVDCARLAYKPQPVREATSRTAPCGLNIRGNGVIRIDQMVTDHAERCFYCREGITLEVQQAQLDRTDH